MKVMSDLTVILSSVGFSGCAITCIIFYLCFGESQRSVSDESLYANARRARSSELDVNFPLPTKMKPTASPETTMMYDIEEEQILDE